RLTHACSTSIAPRAASCSSRSLATVAFSVPTVITSVRRAGTVAVSDSAYATWRRIHIGASALIAIMALLHTIMTTVLYDSWSPDALWFLGAGLGLLLVGVLNLTHIGVEPCRMP